MSGTIIGISGGDLISTTPLNKFALSLTGKEHPHVLFLPTASQDAQPYIETITRYYESLSCRVSALCAVTNSYSPSGISELFQEADLIYVGGGDTEFLLEQWQKFGIDQEIQDAYQRGKILTGISAGMLLWFRFGFSDSDYFKNPEQWDYKFVPGLNRFPYAVCPHYNEEDRNCFDERLPETGMDGIALDNDTAIVIRNDRLSVKKADPNANAYLFRRTETGYRKINLQENEFFR